MIRGELTCGFRYEIDEETLDDMEVLELIHEVDEDRSMLPELILRILGPQQKKAFYETLRTEKGNIPIGDTVEALRELFAQHSETKNSSPSPE